MLRPAAEGPSPVEKLQSQRSVLLYFSPGCSTCRVCKNSDFFRHQVLEKKNLRYFPSSLWECWGVFAQQEAQIVVLPFFSIFGVEVFSERLISVRDWEKKSMHSLYAGRVPVESS